MKRRTLIQGLAAGIGMLVALPGCRQTPVQVRNWTELARLATGLMEAEINAVSHSARAAGSPADWRSRLPELHALKWHDDGAATRLGPTQLRQTLQAAIQTQYRENRFRVMGGWVLSELECAICALR